MTEPADLLRYEPEDLDGHTLEELSDYLDRGRTPRDPSIEGSPSCRIALDALTRLRETTAGFLDAADADGTAGRDWVDAVIDAIPVDARPGRRFPVPVPHPDVTVHVTEGALRALVRSVGDAVPGLLVGGVRFAPAGPVPLEVDVALVHGFRLVPAVDALRSALRRALSAHAPFDVARVDVRVVALIELEEAGA